MTLRSSLSFYTGLPSQDQIALFSRGLLVENFQQIAINAETTLTDSQVYAHLVPLSVGDVASGVAFYVTRPGSGTAPTHFYGALYDLTGTRLAVTADSKSSTQLTSEQTASLSFSTAYTVPATGCYYAALLEVGAFGTDTLRLGVFGVGPSSATDPVFPLGSNAAPVVAQASQASMPSTATFTRAAYNVATPFWIALF